MAKSKKDEKLEELRGYAASDFDYFYGESFREEIEDMSIYDDDYNDFDDFRNAFIDSDCDGENSVEDILNDNDCTAKEYIGRSLSKVAFELNGQTKTLNDYLSGSDDCDDEDPGYEDFLTDLYASIKDDYIKDWWNEHKGKMLYEDFSVGKEAFYGVETPDGNGGHRLWFFSKLNETVKSAQENEKKFKDQVTVYAFSDNTEEFKKLKKGYVWRKHLDDPNDTFFDSDVFDACTQCVPRLFWYEADPNYEAKKKANDSDWSK